MGVAYRPKATERRFRWIISTLRLLALALAVTSAVSLADAAEIEVNNGAIKIQGEIVNGDATRFEDAVRQIGPEVRMVKLRGSPGGDLREAMVIGKLVRKMRLLTDLAILGEKGPMVEMSPVVNADGTRSMIIGTDEDALCASACFFIWIAGVQRQGDYLLVVHRPYFDPGEFGQLNFMQAQTAYAGLEQEAYSYLQTMGTPQSVIDLMRRTSSGDGIRLKSEFVSSELQPMAPDIDEWLRAKCGPFPQEGYNRFRAWWTESPHDLLHEVKMVYLYAQEHDDKELWDAAAEKFKCIGDTLAAERYAAWMKLYGQ